ARPDVMSTTIDDVALGQRPEHDSRAAASVQQCVWSCHPLREEPPMKSVALGLAIVGSAAVMTTSLGNVVYGVIAAVVLIGATMGYLWPTRFILDTHGAAWKQLFWRRRSWSTFRRAERHADGIFLSPFRRRSRLDAYRGLFLRFGTGADVARIDALIRIHVPH
ncbi:MAG: hypothetical protein O2782_10880, partial [bacterium]|nr:hypothetical protein [bacterium]